MHKSTNVAALLYRFLRFKLRMIGKVLYFLAGIFIGRANQDGKVQTADT